MADIDRIPNMGAYGDIFLVDTPHFDNAVNRLYDEQRQREQFHQKEAFALDQMVEKEFGKIRSIDTPEVIDNYQRYKEIKKKLLFDRKAQRDPQMYNQLQREAGLALQDVYKGINRSQELLEGAKMEDQARNRQPNLYDDNYGNLRATFWNTPMSKLGETEVGDLSNPDTYRYKGSNTDFQKLINTAIGTPKPVFSAEEAVDKSGLQTKVTPYSFGNTPAQVKESLLGGMGMHRAGRDAEYSWDQLPQEEIETTIAQYKNIPQEKWQRMGVQGPQDLTPRNPQSKAENYASYLAMKYAIANEPKQGTPQYRNNKDAQMDRALEDWITKEGIRQKNRQGLIALRETNKQMNKAQEGVWLDSYMGEMVSEGSKIPKQKYTYAGGESMVESQIPIDALSAKALSRQGIEPDAIRIMEDGRIRPVFYEYHAKGTANEGKPKVKDGAFLVDAVLSQPITWKQFKVNLSKHTQTAKQRAAEMGGQPAQTTTTTQSTDFRTKYNY